MLMSEGQEEPDGLCRYHLSKDMTLWNFSTWAPILGRGPGGFCHEPPEQHCTEARCHFDTFGPHCCPSILNLCWNNRLENQHLLSACSVRCTSIHVTVHWHHKLWDTPSRCHRFSTLQMENMQFRKMKYVAWELRARNRRGQECSLDCVTPDPSV